MSDIVPQSDASKEVALETTTRYHRLARSWVMTDPVHAKVELVTNSVDAWRRHRTKTLEEHGEEAVAAIRNEIEIEEDLAGRCMYVRDFATGMSADKMRAALLVIGARTAEGDESRGTFSSGAKNTAQLGKVWWLSAHNGRYSSCYITMEETGAIVDDNVPLTEEHRELLRLGSSQTGTTVVLEYAPHVVTDYGSRLLTRFLHYFSMRDIFSDPNLTVRARFRNPRDDDPAAQFVRARHAVVDSDSIYARALPLLNGEPLNGEWSDWFTLSYPGHAGTLIDRYGYTVPEYPDAHAYFEIFQTLEPMSVPEVNEEDTLQFGFSIATGRAVHEHSCLTAEIRRNEDARHFYGRLRCDYIDDLLKRYDLDGPTQDNPVAIIDPGRLYGLNRSHPFVQWLISGPIDRIKLELRRLRDEFDRKNGIASEDVLNLVGNLEKIGTELFEAKEIELEWRAEETGSLLKAVQRHNETVFVRSVDLTELYNPNPRLLGERDVSATFVFSDDQIIRKIEENVFRDASGTVDASAATLTPVHIDERGVLIEPQDLPDDSDADINRTLKPRMRVEIIYTDVETFRKRYRVTLDDDVLTVTINIRSPCFMGQLRRDPETQKIVGHDKVGPILIDTLVHAFTRIYVERKIQSATERNVVHANNAAAGEAFKYAEEFDTALILIEREMYRRVGRAIANGALEDDGVVTLDEVISV